jgi:hypothetical protein
MVKPEIRVNLLGKTKKTHIPLLEAEFAGLAECGAGKLSICDSWFLTAAGESFTSIEQRLHAL